MNKRIISLFLTAIVIFAAALPVHAETLEGDPNWKVTFTSDAKMVNNFKTSSFADELSKMQPGDDAVFTIRVSNENGNGTDWYMANEVVESMEDNSVANGGAYTYRLTYTAPDGRETVIYDSERVGGIEGSEEETGEENGGSTEGGDEPQNPLNPDEPGSDKKEGALQQKDNPAGDDEETDGSGISGNDVSGDDLRGLHEATSSLKVYFLLGTLERGQSGQVTLNVGLDGETQGNSYQDTLANLTMNFAVERHPDIPSGGHRRYVTVERPNTELVYTYLEDEDVARAGTVRTSDDNKVLFFTLLTLTTGMVLLLLSLYCRKAAGKEEE